MSDHDLDKYLEGLGIDVTDEQDEAADLGDLLPEEPDYDQPSYSPGPLLEGSLLDRAEAFLVETLMNIDPAYAVEVEEVDGEIHADVYGGDHGRLIGRSGRTLSALEFVTNAVVNHDQDDWTRVNVDVGGYKRRRDDRLRKDAAAAASRVRKEGDPVEMQPMSAAERRVVHMALADEPDLITESTGEGADRRVVVKPA